MTHLKVTTIANIYVSHYMYMLYITHRKHTTSLNTGYSLNTLTVNTYVLSR